MPLLNGSLDGLIYYADSQLILNEQGNLWNDSVNDDSQHFDSLLGLKNLHHSSQHVVTLWVECKGLYLLQD